MLLQFSGQDILPSPVASCGSVFAVERVRRKINLNPVTTPVSRIYKHLFSLLPQVSPISWPSYASVLGDTVLETGSSLEFWEYR